MFGFFFHACYASKIYSCGAFVVDERVDVLIAHPLCEQSFCHALLFIGKSGWLFRGALAPMIRLGRLATHALTLQPRSIARRCYGQQIQWKLDGERGRRASCGRGIVILVGVCGSRRAYR